MVAAAPEYYFLFRICWYRCLQKVKVYEQTKFRRHISIDGWDITTSVFETQTSAILEIYFWFRFRPFARNLHIILHQATEFCPNRKYDGNMTSYQFLKMAATTAEYYFRFRICRCHCLQKVKVISKPNFVVISQMEAEIFLWQSKMAWEDVNIFSKWRMCQYPKMLCHILWIQKCIFDACRLSLHNFTPSHCTKRIGMTSAHPPYKHSCCLLT